MTQPLLASGLQPGGEASYYVVTSDDVVALDASQVSREDDGFVCLIEQEVRGRRNEVVPKALANLLGTFGFEWEPLSEPGHMRYVEHAAFMLERAKDHAARTAESILQSLNVRSVRLDGVSLIDPAPDVMRVYLRLTTGEPSLYGDSPYHVGGNGSSYMLRQTSCFQKYSACLDHVLRAESLPLSIFELSDSFRREPADTLQLSFRLRRFHLPEAHIHTRKLAEAVELSQQLHPRIVGALHDLDVDIVLLISATHSFARRHGDYFKRLAAHVGRPALLKVSPPGGVCEDGVEVDVEYKLIDSMGCCRELSTFQIDNEITRTFGVRCDDGSTPSTIHAVPTGGVERYIYFALDRIVRSDHRERRHLPLWMSPVVARVVPSTLDAVASAILTARRLSSAGIRTELDDTSASIESALHNADRLLVPYVLLVGAESGTDEHVPVRDFRSGRFRGRDIRELIAEIEAASTRASNDVFQRLSRQPFTSVRTSEEARSDF